MRFIALIALFLFISACAQAQLSERGLIYLKKSEKYGRMKNTGRTLVLAGVVVGAIGVVTLSNVEYTTNNNGYSSQTTHTGNLEAGLAAFLVGYAAIGAGIPLWIIGGINQKRYTKKLELDRYSGSVNRSSYNAGLTLRLRF